MARSIVATDNFADLTGFTSQRGSFSVASNKCTGAGTGESDSVRASGTYSDNQYTEQQIDTLAAGAKYIQPTVQAKGTHGGGTLTMYGLWTDGAGDSNYYKRQNNTTTTLGTAISASISAGQKVSLEVNSDAIQAYLDGVAQGSGASPALGLTGGKPGIGSDGAAVFYNGEFGDITAGGGTTRGTPFGHRSTAFNGGRTFHGVIQ